MKRRNLGPHPHLTVVRPSDTGHGQAPQQQAAGHAHADASATGHAPATLPTAGLDVSIPALVHDLVDSAECFKGLDDDRLFVRVRTPEGLRTLTLPDQVADWLRREVFRATGLPLPRAIAKDALEGLAAQAAYGGEARKVFARVGETHGCVYVDLGDETGRAVRCDKRRWSIIDDPPVAFIREGTHPLPIPVHGGSVDLLRGLVNVADDSDFRLLVGWCLTTLHPARNYPVLVLQGERGSGKSTTAEVLKRLLDPGPACNEALSHTERDFAIAISKSHVASFDNLSGISPSKSDWICRVATGGTFRTRKLYSDDAVVTFRMCLPTILTGIDSLLTREDLASRAIVVEPPAISDSNRGTLKGIWSWFDENAPAILGALLDGVCCALNNESTTTVDKLPRMADAAVWVTAAEEAFGWPRAAFVADLKANAQRSAERAVADHPLASLVREGASAAHGRHVETTCTQLLEMVARRYRGTGISSLPRSPEAVGKQLRRLAPALREQGIEVRFGQRTTSDRSHFVEFWDSGAVGHAQLASCGIDDTVVERSDSSDRGLCETHTSEPHHGQTSAVTEVRRSDLSEVSDLSEPSESGQDGR